MTSSTALRELAEDTWMITERDRSAGNGVETLGSSFLIANGYMGYRGTLEEDTRERMTATIVAGLYDRVGDKWREPVNMPNALQLRLSAEDTTLDARTGTVRGHAQSLDLKRGVHERKTTFVLPSGNTLSVTCTRFASAASLHLLCLRCVVEARMDCTAVARICIDSDVWDLNGPHLEDFDVRLGREISTVVARTHEQGVVGAVSQGITATARAERSREGKNAVADLVLTLQAGVPMTVDVLAAVFTGHDCSDPAAEADALCRDAREKGFPLLLSEHCAVWQSRWETCDIVIDGDTQGQRALRFNMYHLLAIAPTHSDRLSIPARGLSGQMYKGAIFWDTEVFMLPFFTFSFPAMARNLLLYRFQTLAGARRKAREYGYRGAFYAWESQETGDDACTLFNVTDVITHRLIRTYFRDKQIHISADIAYAFWGYVNATGDVSILLDGGAEVVFECARFLLSTLYYSRERRRYESLDVTGPDEYHERVHNDAFTNWIVAHALDVCLSVSELLARDAPEVHAALIERLGFARDLEAIREVRNSYYRPCPDNDSLIIPQFDGYRALEDAPLEEVLRRKLHPNEYLGGGNGVATTTQIIKQADVVLCLALLGGGVSRAVKAANWDYYEPRTEHGSSLSACAYSIVAAETGRVDRAYDYFMKTATTDLGAGHKSFVGTLYIGGTHPAASGGAWMAAVFGLCGITVEGEIIRISPHLPPTWRHVCVPLTVRGSRVRITVSADSVVVETDANTGLRFFIQGRPIAVPPEGFVRIALGSPKDPRL